MISRDVMMKRQSNLIQVYNGFQFNKNNQDSRKEDLLKLLRENASIDAAIPIYNINDEKSAFK